MSCLLLEKALPLAFRYPASTSTDVQSGAKDQMLRHIVKHIHNCCPNIAYTLSDKDMSKINAFCTQIPTTNSVSKSGPDLFSASKLGNQQLDQSPSYLKWKELQLDWSVCGPIAN